MVTWKTAESLRDSEQYLTTGCKTLDGALRGGIARRGITQIYGAAGTGKTQYALQLCLSVQIPESEGGCGAAAVYICTESVFPTRRLQQLLKSSELVKNHGASGDKIYVEHVSTISELESCLFERIPRLMAVQKIGLLVIDSIAAPYRVEYSDHELKNRAKSLRSIGQNLHNLCRNYELSTVCINQFIFMREGDGSRLALMRTTATVQVKWTSQRYRTNIACCEVHLTCIIAVVLISASLEPPPSLLARVSAAVDNKDSANACDGNLPTLGITWNSLITNSFCLVKSGDRRALHVRESPYLPRKSVPFEIRLSGITGL